VYLRGLIALHRWKYMVVAGEVVEPAIAFRVANGAEKEDHLVGSPANDESAADHQCRDCSVASGCV